MLWLKNSFPQTYKILTNFGLPSLNTTIEFFKQLKDVLTSFQKTLILSALIVKFYYIFLSKNNIKATVFSRLFTHVVSTEKMRNDLRDRKDSRGTNYTYYISCFLILLLLKVDMGLFHF